MTEQEEHAPATRAVAELEQLRAHARLILRLYLPGPSREALLRENAAAQVKTRAHLHALLATMPREPAATRLRFGGRGSLAPGWHLRW